MCRLYFLKSVSQSFRTFWRKTIRKSCPCMSRWCCDKLRRSSEQISCCLIVVMCAVQHWSLPAAISCNFSKSLFRVASCCLIIFKLQDEDDDEEDLFMSMRHGKPWKLSRRIQVFHGISLSNAAQRKAKKMMKRRRNLSGKAQLNVFKIGSHCSVYSSLKSLALIVVKVWLKRRFVRRMRGSPLKALVRGRHWTILDSTGDFERARVSFCKFEDRTYYREGGTVKNRT